VATAFNKLGKFCIGRYFPRSIAAEDSFRGLMGLARDMCDDGRLHGQAVANVSHAVAKMSAAGKLAANDADVPGTRAALEKRVGLVASKMESQQVANSIWSFATLGRMPGAGAMPALEVAVVRFGPSMNVQDISSTVLAYGKLGMMPGVAAWAALEAAVVREGPCGTNAQAVANTLWGVSTLDEIGILLTSTRCPVETHLTATTSV
jgi:hypothetical protein